MLVGGPGCPECRSRSLIFATEAPVSLYGRTCPKAPSVLKSRGGVVPADLLRLRIPDARLSGGPVRGGAESCGPSHPVRRARSTGRRRCRLVEVGTGSLLASGVRRMQRGRYGGTSVCPCLNAAAAFSHSAIALPLAMASPTALFRSAGFSTAWASRAATSVWAVSTNSFICPMFSTPWLSRHPRHDSSAAADSSTDPEALWEVQASPLGPVTVGVLM